MPGGQTAQEAEQVVGDVAQGVGMVFPIAGAVLELADQIVSLFGTTHPLGHDVFIGIPAGADMATIDENPNAGDAITNQVGLDLADLLTQIFQSWKQQGAVLSNPNLVIEIRDDGTPGMLFHPQYVIAMNAQELAATGVGYGWALGNGWNDRDSSQYWGLGPIENVQGMVNSLYNVFKSQGWIKIAAPATNGNPAAPTQAVSASGTVASVPALLSSDIHIGTVSIPIWLLLGAGLLFMNSKR